MSKRLKLYTVEFEPVCPVGCCLVLLAHDTEEAKAIARQTITHTSVFEVKEVKMHAGVVEYMSGDY